jgi:hypothetical protein
MYAQATLAGLALLTAVGAAPSNASIGTSLVAAPHDSSAFTGVAINPSSKGSSILANSLYGGQHLCLVYH